MLWLSDPASLSGYSWNSKTKILNLAFCFPNMESSYMFLILILCNPHPLMSQKTRNLNPAHKKIEMEKCPWKHFQKYCFVNKVIQSQGLKYFRFIPHISQPACCCNSVTVFWPHTPIEVGTLIAQMYLIQIQIQQDEDLHIIFLKTKHCNLFRIRIIQNYSPSESRTHCQGQAKV